MALRCLGTNGSLCTTARSSLTELLSLSLHPRNAPLFHRSLSSSACLNSGHNRWSKIRHDKGAADRKKMAARTEMSKLISFHSKEGGADPKLNPSLATAIAAAKKANVPSSFIEAAIARGQGRSLSGASLESLSLEAIMPGGVAIIIDVVTDSRLRSLHEINAVVRKHNGKTGASTKFSFTHLRKMVFAAPSDADPAPSPPSDDDLMNFVLLHDAVDFDRVAEEGDDAAESIVVYTEYEPGKSEVARAFLEEFGFPQRSEDLVWQPKQDMQVGLASSVHAQDLAELLGALQDFSEVSATYINAAQGSISDDEWEQVQQNIITP